jgi:hypothetical protein
MKTFEDHDTHGRRTLPGAMALISGKKDKEIRDYRKAAPVSKNSYTCPFTYYHVTDMLLTLWPTEMTSTKEFTDSLADRPLQWDAITVGRVIADIQSRLFETNGRKPIESARWWDGKKFWVSPQTEDRVALENLLDDLRMLLDQPTDGKSPLTRCPSLR